MKTVEYRVRPVTRYIVTKYTSSDEPGEPCGVDTCGEFDNEQQAHNALKAFEAVDLVAVDVREHNAS